MDFETTWRLLGEVTPEDLEILRRTNYQLEIKEVPYISSLFQETYYGYKTTLRSSTTEVYITTYYPEDETWLKLNFSERIVFYTRRQLNYRNFYFNPKEN